MSRVRKDQRATPVMLVRQERRAKLDRPQREDHKAQRVHKARRATRVHKDRRDQKAQPVLRDQKDRRDQQDRLVQTASAQSARF